MPNDNLPAWLIDTYFAQQKVDQIRVLQYADVPADVVTPEQCLAFVNQTIADYNAANNASLTLQGNFQECNGYGYPSGVAENQLNVSPNPMFDVAVYAQAVADVNNANPSLYAGDVPEGGWNAGNELGTMYGYGFSAWEHYNQTWDQDWNGHRPQPSNNFDTQAYIQARLAHMEEGSTVEDAIAAIKNGGTNTLSASGVSNPITDFYVWGLANGITADDVKPTNTVTVAMPDNWTPWGDSPAPVEAPDPYTVDVTEVPATTGTDDLKGEDGVNTEFVTNYSNLYADQTLQANDQFHGGANAYNTLQVTLGNDWGGFAGVQAKNEETGATTTEPNVTGVGRLLLEHIHTDTERNYKFDAKNIQGKDADHANSLERVDLVNKDGGTVEMSNLPGSVQEVRISGESSNVKGTTIGYAKNAVNGSDDALKLVLDNVGAAAVAATDTTAAVPQKNALINTKGIEHLTVQSQTDSDNFVDLSGMTGLETIAFTGKGDIEVTKVPSRGITSYDASQAEGNVNMAVGNINGSTVIKGGAGADTVTLTTGNNNFAANWTSVENLALTDSASCRLDLTNSDGSLGQLWLSGSGNAVLNGVHTANGAFVINQASKTANATVNGTINDLVWSDQINNEEVSATTTSNVSGNATLNVSDNQTLNNAKFAFADAQGAITLNVAGKDENDSDSEAGEVKATTINAAKAGTFTAQIDGKMGSGNKFTVVNDQPNQGTAVTINAADVDISAANNTTTLKANGATQLILDLAAQGDGTHNIVFDGSLNNAQNVDIQLANTKSNVTDANFTNGTDGYLFDLSPVLKEANTVSVTGDGYENAKLGNLGDDEGNTAINLQANSLYQFTAGTLDTGIGWNIEVGINVTNDVTIGDITAHTNATGNNQGDVTVQISTGTDNGPNNGNLVAASGTNLTIEGDELNIDLSGVKGTILGNTNELHLDADSTIQYTGNDNGAAASGEVIKIDHIGGQGSNIALGGGKDSLTIDQGAVDAKDFVKMTINLNDGDTAAQDTVAIGGALSNTDAKMLITLDGFDSTSGAKDAVSGVFTGTIGGFDATFCDLLERFGLGTDIQVDDVKINQGSQDGTFTYGGYLYAMNDGSISIGAGTASGITTLICLGEDDMNVNGLLS